MTTRPLSKIDSGDRPAVGDIAGLPEAPIDTPRADETIQSSEGAERAMALVDEADQHTGFVEISEDDLLNVDDELEFDILPSKSPSSADELPSKPEPAAADLTAEVDIPTEPEVGDIIGDSTLERNFFIEGDRMDYRNSVDHIFENTENPDETETETADEAQARIASTVLLKERFAKLLVAIVASLAVIIGVKQSKILDFIQLPEITLASNDTTPNEGSAEAQTERRTWGEWVEDTFYGPSEEVAQAEQAQQAQPPSFFEQYSIDTIVGAVEATVQMLDRVNMGNIMVPERITDEIDISTLATAIQVEGALVRSLDNLVEISIPDSELAGTRLTVNTVVTGLYLRTEDGAKIVDGARFESARRGSELIATGLTDIFVFTHPVTGLDIQGKWIQAYPTDGDASQAAYYFAGFLGKTNPNPVSTPTTNLTASVQAVDADPAIEFEVLDASADVDNTDSTVAADQPEETSAPTVEVADTNTIPNTQEPVLDSTEAVSYNYNRPNVESLFIATGQILETLGELNTYQMSTELKFHYSQVQIRMASIMDYATQALANNNTEALRLNFEQAKAEIISLFSFIEREGVSIHVIDRLFPQLSTVLRLTLDDLVYAPTSSVTPMAPSAVFASVEQVDPTVSVSKAGKNRERRIVEKGQRQLVTYTTNKGVTGTYELKGTETVVGADGVEHQYVILVKPGSNLEVRVNRATLEANPERLLLGQTIEMEVEADVCPEVLRACIQDNVSAVA